MTININKIKLMQDIYLNDIFLQIMHEMQLDYDSNIIQLT
jgi:hypothetical protein